MFGINGSELLVLIVLALLVIGPEKLPELAQQLARVTREVKSIAVGAREKVQEELGEEYEELANFDPRQYDPRRIVREALADEDQPRAPAAGAAARRAARAATAGSGTAAGAAAATGGAASATAHRPAATKGAAKAPKGSTPPARPRHGDPGYVVPHDAEAT